MEKNFFKIVAKITLPFVLLSSCDYAVVEEKSLTEVCERAYFEGQRDALNGDVRIKLNSDSCYYWIKSPWDSGKSPIYVPTYLETKEVN